MDSAMMKYRKAFIRNDNEHYTAYLSAVEKHEAVLHADTLYPTPDLNPEDDGASTSFASNTDTLPLPRRRRRRSERS